MENDNKDQNNNSYASDYGNTDISDEVKPKRSLREIYKGMNAKQRKILYSFCAGVLVFLIFGTLSTVQRIKIQQAQLRSKYVTQTVEKGNIKTTVNGTGKLKKAESEKLLVPVGINVIDVFVKSGDQVKKGDTLAKLDPVTFGVLVNNKKTELDAKSAQINAITSSEELYSLGSPINGRIKKLYASIGSDVEKVMAEYGALGLISTDGYMAVDFKIKGFNGASETTLPSGGFTQETDTTFAQTPTTLPPTESQTSPVTTTGAITTAEQTTVGEPPVGQASVIEKPSVAFLANETAAEESVYVGQIVTVRLQNGVEKRGMVKKISDDGKATVLVSDYEANFGQRAEIIDQNGEELGTGNLYINAPAQIIASNGTVTAMNAAENTDIKASDPVFTLGQVTKFAGNLSLIGENNEVTAAVDGRVKKLFAKVGESTDKIVRENGSLALISLDGLMAVDFYTDSADSYSVGDRVTVVCENSVKRRGSIEYIDLDKITVTLSDSEVGVDEHVTVQNTSGDKIGDGTLYIHREYKLIASGGTIKEVNMKEGTLIKKSISLLSLTKVEESAEYLLLLDEYNELLKEFTQFTKMYETGVIKATASGIIRSVNIKKGSPTSQADVQNENQQNPLDGFNIDDYQGLISDFMSADFAKPQASFLNASAVKPSAAFIETETEAETYTDDTALTEGDEVMAAFTLDSNERMNLNISVDELDILQLETGDAVTIKVDALNYKALPGFITEIADEAQDSDGASLFTVTISVEKDSGMRAGMSASAEIVVEDRQSILLIPVEALNEYGTRIYVYSELNKKKRELDKEIDIDTGASDGAMVEIVDGLEEGQTIYYEKPTQSERNPFD